MNLNRFFYIYTFMVIHQIKSIGIIFAFDILYIERERESSFLRKVKAIKEICFLIPQIYFNIFSFQILFSKFSQAVWYLINYKNKKFYINMMKLNPDILFNNLNIFFSIST